MVKHEIKKITHYEYWSWWVYYFPLIPLFLWYSFKARSLLYFTTVNPNMKYGGLFGYSKYKIQKQIPEEFRPKHEFIAKGDKINTNFNFPLVAKPDKGQRGKDVQIIDNSEQLMHHLNQTDDDVIVQEFIDSLNEYGLFYVRLPNDEKGKIVSITGKKFLTFVGDGKSSLREFIESDSRAYFNKSYLYMKYHHQQELILPYGDKMILELIGNHNRGTYFYEATNSNSPYLELALDQIAQNIDGFYFGRFDVKADSLEALQDGKFLVLEVNGANSEATHIFDKKYNLLQSYREVIRHLKAQYMVAKQNMQRGIEPDKIGEFLSDFYKNILIARTE